MSDVVVTVPKDLWAHWLAEGDLPGEPWSGLYSCFTVSRRPKIQPGERVYVVAHRKLRGYAPLQRVGDERGTTALIRTDGAVAVTIPLVIPGFRGWRYRWWSRANEVPFPEWETP